MSRTDLQESQYTCIENAVVVGFGIAVYFPALVLHSIHFCSVLYYVNIYYVNHGPMPGSGPPLPNYNCYVPIEVWACFSSDV